MGVDACSHCRTTQSNFSQGLLGPLQPLNAVFGLSGKSFKFLT